MKNGGISMEVSRRKFLGSSTAAVLAAGTLTKGKAFGANDKIGVCVIGCNGRGGSHISGFMGHEGSEVVALCDVDQKVLDDRVAEIKEKTGKTVKTYRDMRDALADDSIDAVSIATPNHWHSLASIWAIRAGKDVYVEKPLSHNVWEGRRLAEEAAKSGRVVQHGTQSRSDRNLMRDIKLIHNGFIGKMYLAKGFTYKTGNRNSIGFAEPKSPPENLDWNLWQGPAQEQQYCDNYVHYNWHWFWRYGNGEFGNQLVHEMDIGVWGVNAGLPVKIQSTGGRYLWDDQGETPNTHITTFDYGNGVTMLMEVRNLGSYKEAGEATTGNTFLCENGYYIRGKGFFDKDHNPIEVKEELPESDGNYGNFIKVVRSRKPEDNPCDALVGHISSAHCHLGNIAYRLQETLRFDPDKERFTNNDEANKHLKPDYRSGFEVPETA
jgi:predicted dehydrogenase